VRSVRVSDLRQYAFCPRVIWHRVVMGEPTRETPKMRMGREAEAALVRLEKRRRLRRYGLQEAARRFDVALESERLGLHGVCDLVLDVPERVEPWPRTGNPPPSGLRPVELRTGARTFPVEIKTTRGGVGRHHVVQLAAYAMLLEEGRTPIDRGFLLLLPEDRIATVRIGPQERALVERTRDAILRMLDEQRFPEPTRFRSFCPDCEYLNFCGDVL
jgi:CRISPR-associated exonuclease Cas4